MFSFIRNIKSKGLITSNYRGDQKEPWVSPLNIASAFAEEVELRFHGKTVRNVASDEVSPNEFAAALGQPIGKPGLKWNVISDEHLMGAWLGISFNPQVAHCFVEMKTSQGTSGKFSNPDAATYRDFP